MSFVANSSPRPGTQHLFRIEARQADSRQGSSKNHGESGKRDGCGENHGIGSQVEKHWKIRLFDVANEERAHPLR